MHNLPFFNLFFRSPSKKKRKKHSHLIIDKTVDAVAFFFLNYIFKNNKIKITDDTQFVKNSKIWKIR